MHPGLGVPQGARPPRVGQGHVGGGPQGHGGAGGVLGGGVDGGAHSDLGGSNFRFFYPHFSFYFWVAIVVKYQKFVVATAFLSFKYQFFDNLFSNLFNFRRQIRKTQIPR